MGWTIKFSPTNLDIRYGIVLLFCCLGYYSKLEILKRIRNMDVMSVNQYGFSSID